MSDPLQPKHIPYLTDDQKLDILEEIEEGMPEHLVMVRVCDSGGWNNTPPRRIIGIYVIKDFHTMLEWAGYESCFNTMTVAGVRRLLTE